MDVLEPQTFKEKCKTFLIAAFFLLLIILVYLMFRLLNSAIDFGEGVDYSMQISIFCAFLNVLYLSFFMRIGQYLTDRENYKLQAEYDESLISYVYYFSCTSLFFILMVNAFIDQDFWRVMIQTLAMVLFWDVFFKLGKVFVPSM